VKEVRNEQRKLLAAWFNNLGTGIISVGVLTPAAAFILGINPGGTPVATFVLVLAFSTLMGCGFHLIGTLVLLGYEP
jgi:ABC-type transport system involved in multi-copper enzyme maturation permease subunit